MLEGVPFRGRECVCGEYAHINLQTPPSLAPSECHLLYLRGGNNKGMSLHKIVKPILWSDVLTKDKRDISVRQPK